MTDASLVYETTGGGWLIQSGCLPPNEWPGHGERPANMVINMTPECPVLEPPHGAIYVRLPIDDGPMMDFDVCDLRVVARAVAQALEQDRRVHVHCGAGINRASLLSARALMFLGLSPEQAIETLRAKRIGALSNGEFTAWLMREGPSLQSDFAASEIL